jgi:hypothetical protein
MLTDTNCLAQHPKVMPPHVMGHKSVAKLWLLLLLSPEIAGQQVNAWGASLERQLQGIGDVQEELLQNMDGGFLGGLDSKITLPWVFD